NRTPPGRPCQAAWRRAASSAGGRRSSSGGSGRGRFPVPVPCVSRAGAVREPAYLPPPRSADQRCAKEMERRHGPAPRSVPRGGAEELRDRRRYRAIRAWGPFVKEPPPDYEPAASVTTLL